jgi:hypothetical protein
MMVKRKRKSTSKAKMPTTTTGNKLNKQLMFVSIKYMAEQIVAEKKKKQRKSTVGVCI